VAVSSGLRRSDVERAVPGAGPTAGFAGEIALGTATGNRRVCVDAVDAPTGERTRLRCLDLNVPADHLLGNLDLVRAGGGEVRVGGWLIDWTRSTPVAFRILANGREVASGVASASRPDVGRVWSGFGSERGVDVAFPLGPGRSEICVEAIGVGPGSASVRVGCRTVDVMSGDPFGSLDLASPSLGQLRVAGWSIDPDVVGAVRVHVYVGGVFAGELEASSRRGDVGRAFPAYGPMHGYDGEVRTVGARGATPVCVFAINEGPGTTNPLLGCRTVEVVSGNPVGSLDVASPSSGQVRVAGWSIDPDVLDPVRIHIYVGGVFAGELVASSRRGDVGRAFPAFGPSHGYDGEVSTVGARGATPVCAFAINQGPGTTNPLLGCRTVEFPAPP